MNLKDFFIIVGPMRIDSDEFVCHPVVFSHVQGVHGRQTGLLIDTAVTCKARLHVYDQTIAKRH
jgi:hypothetical protein